MSNGASVALPSTFVSPVKFFSSGSFTSPNAYTFDGSSWGSGGTVPGVTSEIYYQCAVYFDDTKVLVIGGIKGKHQDVNLSRKIHFV